MAPLTKAASSASLRNKDNGIGEVEQFGRSATSLHAEKAAASLKSPTRQASSQNLATGPLDKEILTDEKSKDLLVDAKSIESDHEFDFGVPPSQPAPQRTTPFSPTISSPLNPSRSNSDGSSGAKSVEAGLAADVRPKTATERRRLQKGGSRGSLRRPQNKSTPELYSQALRAPGSGLSLHELGSDYTRYYNPFDSAKSSARNSFSEKRPSSKMSALGGIYPANPFLTPNVSTTKLNQLYDPEKNGSWVDDRLSAPYNEKGMAGWPLITDQEEPDDDMHMPHPDDDIKYKASLRDHFTRDSIASTIGLILMICGLLFVFVGLPVLSSLGIIDYNSAYGNYRAPNPYAPQEWATVNNRDYDFLKNMRRGLIDPDTPKSAKKMKGEFGDDYVLVFSDEFNTPNRTFYEGDDPYFFAADFWYGATKDLEWYDPDAVTTWDGTLELRLDKFLNHGLNFRSGMLNSWNQLCFKGGIFEISASLPGPGGVPGLWPGAWTMGNLGRPGYLATTDGMWPYTYQACDVGITPNQSSYDGLSNLPGQRLPSCTCKGEDHPTPGTGRGAPEIDIIEVGATYGGGQNMPIATQSLQVAPFDIHWYPNYNYTAFPDFGLSFYNGYTGGPYQQAISATTNLNRNWYDGKEYQRYSFEYAPGEGEDSYVSWKIGGQTMFMVDGRAIGPNGNVKARQISEEPMSIILNLGISNSWTWIDWERLVFPAVMRVDYIRWYQKPGEEMVTCDPPGFETTKYIKEHINAYTNPNFTVSTALCMTIIEHCSNRAAEMG